MTIKSLRRSLLTRPIFSLARRALPTLSDTEREALSIGDIWWDGDLFSGNPDWDKLLETPPATLSEEEQQFLAGPVQDLCAMLDDWDINHQRGDLPPEVWDHLVEHRYFAMIIPKKYGGLEFSAYANSEVIRTIASRSVVGAVTVMVPNSLGPGELLMHFGTEEQRDYWLPRLADGRELPCFALTSTTAGSDAASMTDRGIVCRDTYDGKEVLGIRLNWSKRYITLSPIATILGLAFKLDDPDHLLGDKEHLGITLALVPTRLNGVEVGRRHLPSYQMFMNGPTTGKDVFVPLDHVIGGTDYVGKGWPMLMSALSAGRGISLPSLSSAAAAFCARSTGAYARVREQFGIPIGKFEGIQERLGALAANAYQLDAARRLTCAGLDEGRNLAVISAIMKVHATYRMREAVNDAMDVHGGKGVVDGPLNYIGGLNRAVPIGITVEGANILTRSMIIFGQGAIRCHPWVLKEMLALEENDQEKALAAFDESFWNHVVHSTKTFFRAWSRAWSGGRLGPVPEKANIARYYRRLDRYAAVFALLADFAMLLLGGGLKRREMISARLGDILSELYLLSAVLKRWHDEDSPEEDLPLVEYCLQTGFARMDRRIRSVLDNLPYRPLTTILRFFVQPLGVGAYGPDDRVTSRCAELLLEPSAARDRLTAGLYLGGESSAVSDLEQAFSLVIDTEPLHERMRDAGYRDYRAAVAEGLFSTEEEELLRQTAEMVERVVAVDDFPGDDVGETNFTAKRDNEKKEVKNESA